ncbi:pyridoxal phosphate-dependent aminotransferase [Thermodesulforhabdus norvegica]|uniref:Aminotransferase n=1 Tax=Thermodesulforhabdus norvegica TaxID=39841 RepID=A0A1I4S4F8_9BACT|nr:aminotransferase class I/II-fold pyridoxal phosphate-dependent enzyme [Thermodesulforhabdus norvegica]SFM59365.1 L-threonine O-3-phosphate decarboxylase [Thermodesulforhabdus norvegica]
MIGTASHGGNVYEICRNYGWSIDEIVDLSASINPLGPPEGLKEYLLSRFGEIVHYPDIHNLELIRALAEYHGLPESVFAVGNGSTELLFWLPFALNWRRVAVVLPVFGEYLRSLENAGVIIRKLRTAWETGFQPTVEQLDALVHASNPDVVILTNPGSPSGTLLSGEVLDYIKWSVRKRQNFWLIDEVFVDFCEENSLKELAAREPFLMVIRSLTKFFSLPGLRIGYIVAGADIINKLRLFVPPWSVNIFAQHAAVFCLKDRSFVDKTLSFFDREKKRVKEKLLEIRGIESSPFAANYVLIRLKEEIPLNSTELREQMLLRHRILIRDCRNFEGLSDRYVRIALGLSSTNELWVRALRDTIGDYLPANSKENRALGMGN